MARTYDEITGEERKLITALLTSHAEALTKLAKKLREPPFVQDAVANKLSSQAAKINRELRPIFDDQAEMELETAGEESGGRRKRKSQDEGRNRGLLLTAGNPIDG